MATATVSGTLTFPIATGGPNASLVLGSPVVTPSSTSGPTLTFTEKFSNTFLIATGAPTLISFGTVSDGDLLYVGTDQPLDVIFNGGTDTFSLAVGGYILMHHASITALSVEATLVAATVEVVVLGA